MSICNFYIQYQNSTSFDIRRANGEQKDMFQQGIEPMTSALTIQLSKHSLHTSFPSLNDI